VVGRRVGGVGGGPGGGLGGEGGGGGEAAEEGGQVDDDSRDDVVLWTLVVERSVRLFFKQIGASVGGVGRCELGPAAAAAAKANGGIVVS